VMLPVNIDTTRPVTRAPSSATVKRYATAALKYRVNDARPGSPTATVQIKIKNSKGVVVRTLKPGVKNVNTTYTAKFVCKLPAGTYRFYVYGKDQAGNVQATVGNNKLVVK
jgi:flagellar hook assembly protein FlgD